MSEPKKEIDQVIIAIEKEIPKNTCCVCGHPLSSHIDEGDGWRCHSLAQDFFQCECFLRKGRYDGNDELQAYDLKSRLKRRIEKNDW